MLLLCMKSDCLGTITEFAVKYYKHKKVFLRLYDIFFFKRKDPLLQKGVVHPSHVFLRNIIVCFVLVMCIKPSSMDCVVCTVIMFLCFLFLFRLQLSSVCQGRHSASASRPSGKDPESPRLQCRCPLPLL